MMDIFVYVGSNRQSCLKIIGVSLKTVSLQTAPTNG